MPTTTYPSLRFEQQAGVAQITLDRPDAANTFNLAMAQSLAAVALHCDEDPAVRVVVIKGEGRLFCAGGDLTAFTANGQGVSYHVRELTGALHGALSTLVRMHAPVVAAVHGSAAGAGLSLVCAADLAIGTESSRYVLGYTKAGLSGDAGITWTLPRIVGRRRALAFVLGRSELTAEEAKELGILSEVVPDDALSERVGEVAERLSTGPTLAYGAFKRLLLESDGRPIEGHMEAESRSIATLAASADGIEGRTAFSERRAPKFSGR